MTTRISFLLLLSGISAIGCAPYRQTMPPPPPPVIQEQPDVEPLRTHLLGIWDRTERAGKAGRLVFREDGTLIFEGAMESASPGEWELNPHDHLLVLTLPHASDETVAIFKMYLRDGVESVDRAVKRITYRFDDQTERLNVAGWVYSKRDATLYRSEARQEPD